MTRSTKRRRLPLSALAGPVGRAVAYQQWSAEGIDAQLHALIGMDPKAMCNAAGRIFYVVLGAASTEGLDADLPDLRVLRGAVNAVADQVDQPQVQQPLRAAIASGLEAVKRMTPSLQRRSLVDAFYDLNAKLAAQHVTYGDFEHLIARTGTSRAAA